MKTVCSQEKEHAILVLVQFVKVYNKPYISFIVFLIFHVHCDYQEFLSVMPVTPCDLVLLLSQLNVDCFIIAYVLPVMATGFTSLSVGNSVLLACLFFTPRNIRTTFYIVKKICYEANFVINKHKLKWQNKINHK